MKRHGQITTAAVAALLAAALLGAALAATEQERSAAARAAADEFQGALRVELIKAFKAGGAPGAISVCRDKAPQIAARMSQQKGWTVGRTAPRVRNAANAPDAWEAAVLDSFAARLARGESLIRMEYGQTVTLPDGKRAYRYMKAIPMGEACVKCHGAELDTAVIAQLRALYPDDKATGFTPGGLRGAFTITQPLAD